MVLFDGPHTYPYIASYAFLVGAFFGGGLILAFAWPEHFELGLYISMLGVFHQLEYMQTAVFNPTRLKLDSFLLNHSNEYHIAILTGFAEYALELYFVPFLKSLFYVKLVGAALMFTGELLRASAMYTAKSSFNHIVQSERAADHVLVTNGVYSLSRHPSYAGFFWYSVGTQILLCNPICSAGFAYVLWTFFNERIEYRQSAFNTINSIYFFIFHFSNQRAIISPFFLCCLSLFLQKKSAT